MKKIIISLALTSNFLILSQKFDIPNCEKMVISLVKKTDEVENLKKSTGKNLGRTESSKTKSYYITDAICKSCKKGFFIFKNKSCCRIKETRCENCSGLGQCLKCAKPYKKYGSNDCLTYQEIDKLRRKKRGKKGGKIYSISVKVKAKNSKEKVLKVELRHPKNEENKGKPDHRQENQNHNKENVEIKHNHPPPPKKRRISRTARFEIFVTVFFSICFSIFICLCCSIFNEHKTRKRRKKMMKQFKKMKKNESIESESTVDTSNPSDADTNILVTDLVCNPFEVIKKMNFEQEKLKNSIKESCTGGKSCFNPFE